MTAAMMAFNPSWSPVGKAQRNFHNLRSLRPNNPHASFLAISR
jgi:hypothetical protein